MSTTIKAGWLNDKDGDKFAPKTLISQVQTADGTSLENKIKADIDALKKETEPLIGTTAEITPSQVLEAITDGRPVAITHEESGLVFTSFTVVNEVAVIGSTLAVDGDATGILALIGIASWTLDTRMLATLDDIPDIPNVLPNPHPLLINGTEYDGSETVDVDIGLEPLIGTTENITPTQVAEAVARGRAVAITHSLPEFGSFVFNNFAASSALGMVFASFNGTNGDVPMVVYVVGSLTNNEWNSTIMLLAQPSDIPETLPNPNALTVNGTEYDGSSAVEVDTTPAEVKFALTDDGGVTTDTPIAFVLLNCAKKTVSAKLSTKGGTHLGAGTFNLIDSAVSTKAVADVMTTEGIYRITAESTRADYKVDYLPYTASGGGIVLFEEATVTSSIVNKLAFQLDTVYDIYWNGILYTCTSYESEAQVYTGNGHLVNTNLPDTGEPFLFTHGKGAASSMLTKASGQPSSNTLMVATHGYKVAGDGTSIDVVAEVGQTIVVEEVDGFGKPTKWRAADYQPRTHWSNGIKELETLAYMSFAGVLDSSIGAYAYTKRRWFSLKEGHQYKVIFDGVEYSGLEARVASLGVNTAVAIGNFSMVGGGGADIPFTAINLPNGYAGFLLFDGNEHTAQIFEIVEDVHKIPTKFVPTLEEMRSEEAVLYEGVVEIDPEADTLLDTTFVPTAGETYKISWNGTEYSCVARAIEDGTVGTVIILGNADSWGLGDTGEPFALEFFQGMGVVIALDGATTVRLSIKGADVIPIPVKYLGEAAPYYVEVTGGGGLDNPYVCNDTVANVNAIYKSGRRLIVRNVVEADGIIVEGYLPLLRREAYGSDVNYVFTAQAVGSGYHHISLLSQGGEPFSVISD